jgi:DNA-binding transcriptional ArsR family regulator
MDAFKRLTFWLLEGTKGGPTRIRLLSLLKTKPMNMHQLSKTAKLDYKSVEHHINLLEKNGLVECTGDGYGKVYFISDNLLSQKGILERIRGEEDGKERKNKGKS